MSDLQVRIADIVEESVVDGLGIRMTIFTQGCPHRCEGCHNPQTHDPSGGGNISIGEIEERIRRNPLLDGVTLSGGEPFSQSKPLSELCRRLHANNLNVWTYTGYTLEELTKASETDADVRALLAETDVLVDGRFVLAQLDLKLKFRGSANQRIIDMKKTRAAGTVVLLME